MLGHLTRPHDSGPIKCVLTIFTTMLHQTSCCRERRREHRSVTITHLIFCWAACNIESSNLKLLPFHERPPVLWLSANSELEACIKMLKRWHLPLKRQQKYRVWSSRTACSQPTLRTEVSDELKYSFYLYWRGTPLHPQGKSIHNLKRRWHPLFIFIGAIQVTNLKSLINLCARASELMIVSQVFQSHREIEKPGDDDRDGNI